MKLEYHQDYHAPHFQPRQDEDYMLALNRQRGLPVLPHQRKALRDDLCAMLSVAIFGDRVANAPHVILRSGSAPMHLSRTSLAEQVSWYCRSFGVVPNGSPKAMLRRALIAPNLRGVDGFGGDAGMLALSMAGADVPSIVADAVGKSSAYLSGKLAASSSLWTRTVYCDRASGMHVSTLAVGALDEIEEGDEAQAVFVSDEGESYVIKQHGNTIGISRQTMVDDGIGAFSSVTAFAGSEAYTLDKLCYGIFTGNADTADGEPYFSTAHSNLVGGALSPSSVGTAMSKLAEQRNARGQPMHLRAAYLIVPVLQAATASQIFGIDLPAADPATPAFPRPIAAPELDATSTIQHYVVCDPSIAPAVVIARPRDYPDATLSARIRFSDDTLQFKYSLWAAAAPGSWRAAVRSSGS